MGKVTDCLFAVLLLAGLSSVLAQERRVEISKGVDLVLGPPSFSAEITSILWKHKTNLVAEWVKEKVPLEYYGMFKGRTTLNTSTAEMKILNVSPADSGVYIVEINNKVQPQSYNVKWMKPVPKPYVKVKPLSCNAESTQCSVSCEGNTTDAEPVRYRWKKGDGQWMDQEDEKNWTINNDETMQSVETFTCQMKNSISEEDSEPKNNPFFRERSAESSSNVGLILGLIAALIIVIIGGLACWKRSWIVNKVGQLFDSGNNNTASKAPDSSPSGESSKKELLKMEEARLLPETAGNTDGESNSKTDGETGGNMDGQTHPKTDGETGGNMDGQTHVKTDGETGGNMDGQTHPKTDGETDAKTDGETDPKTDGETDGTML